MNAFRHRIHTTKQARVCRKLAIAHILRAERDELQRKADLAAQEAVKRQIRSVEIMQAVLKMSDPHSSGDTEALPKVEG